MKNAKLTLAVILICTVLVSCSKEVATLDPNTVSAGITSNVVTREHPEITFDVSTPKTVYLSQVRNTIQSDSFSVTEGTVYVSSFLFKVTNTPILLHPTFYINGGQVRSIITYSNDSVLVRFYKPRAFTEGSYNYILQARTVGVPGSTFSISLNCTVITDSKGKSIETENLPQTGNDFILN